MDESFSTCSNIHTIKETIRGNIDKSDIIKGVPSLKEILYSVFNLDVVYFEKLNDHTDQTRLTDLCSKDEMFYDLVDSMSYLKEIYNNSASEEVDLGWGSKKTARYVILKIPFKFFSFNSLNPSTLLYKIKTRYDTKSTHYTGEKSYHLKIYLDQIYENAIDKLDDIVSQDEYKSCMVPSSRAGGKRIKRKRIKTRKNKRKVKK